MPNDLLSHLTFKDQNGQIKTVDIAVKNVDTTVTENSPNPVTSGAVYDALGDVNSVLDQLITGVSPGAINFYNYDGTIVYSFNNVNEFLQLTAMPDNPSHEGLTAQGWNWSLADAKAYVTAYGKLNIGQMYTTSDGKTRIYVTMYDGRLSPYLKLYLNTNTTLDIDWGDGSTHGSMTTTSTEGYVSLQHTYAEPGDYVIAINATAGTYDFEAVEDRGVVLSNNNESLSSPDVGYLNCITKIEIGSGVTSLGEYAFNGCNSLRTITLPTTVTSLGYYTFYGCISLKSVTIPNSVDYISDGMFGHCTSLESAMIPTSVESIGWASFSDCISLQSITIPDTVGAIDPYAFSGCTSLKYAVIAGTDVQISRNAFENCTLLQDVTITTGIIGIESDAFKGCSSLQSITIPNSIDYIDLSSVGNCTSLRSVTLPDTIDEIGGNAFAGCTSLTSIQIPSSVTSIDSDVFANCYSLKTITINKASGSISGSPWGATTGSPTYTQIVWTG